MSNSRRQILLKSFQLADLFIFILSFAAATFITHQQLDATSLEMFLAIRISMQNFILFFGVMLTWHLVFSFFGLYHSMRLSSRWLEAIDIFKATTVGTVAIFVASVIFNMSMITPIFLIVFWETSCLLTLLSRVVLRFTLDQVRVRGRNLRIILLAGTNKRVLKFADNVIKKPELGYQLAGFVDDKWVCERDGELQKNYPLIHFDELSKYLRDNVVDEVMIGLPIKSYYEKYSKIVSLSIEQGINVRIIADLFFTQVAKSKTENFEGNPIITLYTGSMNYGALLIKRILDIVISLILLILLSPLFVITAIAIKISSPGPVFFCQERLGLYKRLFKLYKFRTMVPDAEKLLQELEEFNEADGPVFKIKNDPRITKIGRFLRVSSIDELPQLLNVLKGDMSLVGPRPLPVRDYEEFDHCWFNRRFSVRPGITCFWQVNGRSDVSFSKWIEMDLRYIDTWSLKLDFLILLKTIPAVLKGEGAT
jgi:exopolysaccharide biosynthesis polyprenyl glycosylphosphotransferase